MQEGLQGAAGSAGRRPAAPAPSTPAIVRWRQRRRQGWNGRWGWPRRRCRPSHGRCCRQQRAARLESSGARQLSKRRPAFSDEVLRNSGGDGCHVIDGASTMSAGGYDHGYDWITAGAHASSCPEKPTPYRYQVVMAVIEAANPATCSKSRRMPPPNATGRAALTACQTAPASLAQ